VARGWTERQLAQAAGTAPEVVCAYEKGQGKGLSRDKLAALVARLGYGREEVQLALLYLSALAAPAAPADLLPTDPSPEQSRQARRLAVRVGLTATAYLQWRLRPAATAGPGDLAGSPAQPPPDGDEHAVPRVVPEGRSGGAAATAAEPDCPVAAGGRVAPEPRRRRQGARPPLSVALRCLREIRGWTQGELAAAAGMSRPSVSSYETGLWHTRQGEGVGALVAALGFRPDELRLTLLFLDVLPAAGAGMPPQVDPEYASVRRAHRLAATVGVEVASTFQQSLLLHARRSRAREQRRAAARQWAILKEASPARQRRLIDAADELHTWAVVERLCDESVAAAAHQAPEALRLARLALRAAALASGPDGFRSLLLSLAWAFVANAQRVADDLDAATAGFARAWTLWRAGRPTGREPFGEWRLLDLEASLLRARRQFEAALDNLRRALASAPAASKPRILLNTATVLEQSGEIAPALATLDQAAPLVEAAAVPRDRWALRLNRLVLLCHLGRFADAEAQLPELRALTLALRNDLDRLRVRWLSARVAAGRGRREESIRELEAVRQEFVIRRLAYDTALVTQELAIHHLEAGRTAEVRRLAAEMLWIFRSKQIEREALAALTLFCKAAETESLTVEAAREALDRFERASRHPRPAVSGRGSAAAAGRQ
jgi:transcriptional regulator with XRE-family HTH domain